MDLCVANRKRLFEKFSELIAKNGGISTSENNGFNSVQEQIFTTLHNRERLGSTALGNGIALPHGRIDGLTEPVIAVAKLEIPIDYDAKGEMPVWLAVCLLVPSKANEIHLNLLAALAAKFDDNEFIREVKLSSTTEELYNLFAGI